MTRLLNAIKESFGPDAVMEPTSSPVPVNTLQLPRERFAEAARAMKKVNALLAAQWASDDTLFGDGLFSVYACYRWGREYLIIKSRMPEDDLSFPSISGEYVPAYRFERQIHSLFGIVPEGNEDLRPWIKFEDWPADAWPLRKTFDAAAPLKRTPGEYGWAEAVGEGVYEIPVGPVHAGIIEPGHFRFQAVGESVLNLEERLGYVHKGIEKRFESMDWSGGGKLAGRVSGDSTVAHALGYSMAVEAMTGCRVPERAQWLRALMLERERIANHMGDIGAICNDVAFALMLFQMMRLKERMLRTNLEIFGHRFMMDKVTIGGVSVNLSVSEMQEIDDEAAWLLGEFDRLVTILDDNASIEDRIIDTGVLRPEKARELGVVGIVARASGLNLDCRIFHPFPPYDMYDRLQLDVPVKITGDVHARLWVRIHEVRESIRIIRWLIENMPVGGGAVGAGCSEPAVGATGFSAVEGWRGEVLYWVQAGRGGEINRCMVRDPSSLNWLGLEQAMPGNIVPDFPVCNKSFNQSYSGHDL